MMQPLGYVGCIFFEILCSPSQEPGTATSDSWWHGFYRSNIICVYHISYTYIHIYVFQIVYLYIYIHTDYRLCVQICICIYTYIHVYTLSGVIKHGQLENPPTEWRFLARNITCFYGFQYTQANQDQCAQNCKVLYCNAMQWKAIYCNAMPCSVLDVGYVMLSSLRFMQPVVQHNSLPC